MICGCHHQTGLDQGASHHTQPLQVLVNCHMLGHGLFLRGIADKQAANA